MVYAQDQLLEIKMLIMNLIVLESKPPTVKHNANIKRGVSGCNVQYCEQIKDRVTRYTCCDEPKHKSSAN